MREKSTINLETAYKQMAQDEIREAEALQWTEAAMEDVAVKAASAQQCEDEG